MAEYTGTFETGVAGNTIATTDAGSDTPWDEVNLGGTSFQYSNVEKYGSLSARQISDSGGVASFVAWDSSTLGSSITTIYGRIYMFLPAGLDGQVIPVRGFDTGSRAWEVVIVSNLLVGVRDQGGTYRGLSSGTIATNQWVRLEWKAINSTTAGFVEAKFFNDADSGTPTETVTSTDSFSTLTKTDLVRFCFADNSAKPSSTFYFDNILVNDTGYPGPFGAPAAPDVLSMQAHVFGHNMW